MNGSVNKNKIIKANRRLKSGNGNNSTHALVFFINGSPKSMEWINLPCLNQFIQSRNYKLFVHVWVFVVVVVAASGATNKTSKIYYEKKK